ncbi:hypothetical protein SNOG_20071 [Parastagonospora nodorum SN15]|uniref:Uncharacterized protein n=1 Tax=Phaeosphaeria nodorum (strain SN15 / ATCC MYA-4574 / FGSC 10173) TaxID=321614 RepID=A9JX68_PHANO|nr:hypothetical protein SNOG_20071 [Parastagonospora nodorum SN15]EDP89927.1 hypothetical protein SNOG_20071 [Parastagonospora nodorum SN15]
MILLFLLVITVFALRLILTSRLHLFILTLQYILILFAPRRTLHQIFIHLFLFPTANILPTNLEPTRAMHLNRKLP